MVEVAIPTHLRSYTSGASAIDASGDTLAAILADVDARHRGLRFRIIDEQDQIRTHIKLFIGTELARDLAARVEPGSRILIVCALSGG